MVKRIVIVGTGQAGFSVAAKLRIEGFSGSIILVGEETEMPYQRPPLSKSYLMGKTGTERLFLRDDVFHCDNNIEVLTGNRALSIVRSVNVVVTATGTLPYDHLVLATGARPAQLPTLATADIDDMFHLRTRLDADRLRSRLHKSLRLLIVGGGYLGLEVAALLVRQVQTSSWWREHDEFLAVWRRNRPQPISDPCINPIVSACLKARTWQVLRKRTVPCRPD